MLQEDIKNKLNNNVTIKGPKVSQNMNPLSVCLIWFLIFMLLVLFSFGTHNGIDIKNKPTHAKRDEKKKVIG